MKKQRIEGEEGRNNSRSKPKVPKNLKESFKKKSRTTIGNNIDEFNWYWLDIWFKYYILLKEKIHNWLIVIDWIETFIKFLFYFNVLDI